MRTILANGTVITPIRALHSSSVIVEGGRIAAVLPSDQVEMQEQDRVIDVGGAYIAPGFIDIHTHGAGGHDFMDGSVEAIMEAARTHLRYGTTTIMPTTLTSDLDELFDTLDKFAQAKSKLKDGPNLHGLHLEGPYFSREQAGAQDPRYIKNPDPDEYRRIVGYSGEVKRWTIAPELPGALEMGRYLSERGILCSMGHTNAVYEDVVAAVENGFRLVTHLYSAMSGVRRINAYRYAGVIESALLLDELTVEVIADGVHLPKSLLQLTYKVKGPDRICLVTDSMRGAGMPEGESILGSLKDGQRVIIEDGVAKLPDRSAFAGSVSTSDRLVRTMVKLAEVPLVDAVKMVTLTPAKLLGIAERKGQIAPGKDGDLVVFDADINVSLVMVGGQVRFEQSQGRDL
ncbi:MAG TPA: N-acetylglucosamine-6-phosphate deacetylase [Limnochordia bacterium]|nr:N-acetylglucosamine-6-phosphate deacetylase [Limnochordia bacterium]NLO95530.1 N-acetylglucosamine-6-phosphate deacetylase [Bacillota bacterium]HAI52576.1 N-acetylglucosamine-6-phosphate deacetylase [Bacillota bacterium]HOB41005.1 N-acetylglucosamine-6-phosphate deacetylase [Limnochordia bacterium]HOK32343.1 N-acetylglucosamine-6-phosphate deacetylase [Limnochordia bacterium]